MALKAPQWRPRPAIDLYETFADGTVVAIDHLGKQGVATTTLEFLASSLDPATAEMRVDAAVGLRESGLLGRTYALHGSARVHLPGASGHTVSPAARSPRSP